jgi:hypothetical protein
MQHRAKLSNSVHLALKNIIASPLTNLQASSNLNQRRSPLETASIFDVVPRGDRQAIQQLTNDAIAGGDIELSRSIASLVGMAIADSLGHNFEFMDVRDSPQQSDSSLPPLHSTCFFEYPSSTPGGVFHNPYNKFRLAPGQWTDDCSMGLCLADSLLTKGDYNGSNLRVWFYNWWVNGLNNAFRLDQDRKGSVGLGGNASSICVFCLDSCRKCCCRKYLQLALRNRNVCT